TLAMTIIGSYGGDHRPRRSIGREVFALLVDSRLGVLAIARVASNLLRAVGKPGLLRDIPRYAIGCHVREAPHLALAAADTQHYEILRLISGKSILNAFGNHNALINSHSCDSSIAEGERCLALQHNERMVLTIMSVHRILSAPG